VRYIFKENLDRRLRSSKRLFIFLDYDGTLTPIVKTPQEAVLSSNIKKVISSLAKKRNIFIGIISGRSLKDVKQRVNIKNIFYAGNHGLEICFKGKIILTNKNLKNYLKILRSIKRDLKNNLKRIEGVIFEDKRLIYGIHYRLVSSSQLDKFKKIFKETISPYLKKGRIKIGRGKKIFEIRPDISFGKDDAIRFFQNLLKKKKEEPTIYIGDDLTDEDVFVFLDKKRDLGIRVGKSKKSNANFYLKNVKEVEKFLTYLDKKYK
jgi:trehalose-phosphatase